MPPLPPMATNGVVMRASGGNEGGNEGGKGGNGFAPNSEYNAHVSNKATVAAAHWRYCQKPKHKNRRTPPKQT